jgi:hypothetical protein
MNYTWKTPGVAATGPEMKPSRPRRPQKGGRRISRSNKQHVAPDTSGEPRRLLPEQSLSRTCRPTPSRQTRATITQQRPELPSPALSRRDLIGARIFC